jgi:chromosome segregation and condensation protein ScpB
MGRHSLFSPDNGAIVAILSASARPLSARIISRRLFNGADRALKGIEVALRELIAEGRVKSVRVQKNGKTYEHYIAGLSKMQEYHIVAGGKGITVKTLIITDDPKRAMALVRLMASSGNWTELTVKANKTTYTLETLGDLV